MKIQEAPSPQGRRARIECNCGRILEAFTFAEAGRLFDQHQAKRYPNGTERQACPRHPFADHDLTIQEDERQLILMALAHLAVERPGWDDALARIAMKMDNQIGGRPQLFDQFKELHTPTK